MNKELIANLLVQSSKKAMLDFIEVTDDIEFLRTEFTKTLKEKWDLQQERDKYKSIVDELKKRIEDAKRKIPKNRRYKYKSVYGIEEVPEKEHRDYICFLVFEAMERLVKELEEGKK